MKKIVTLAILGLLILAAWLTDSKARRARRQSTYRAALAPFQHDLPLGMPRADVEKYLRSRGMQYSWQNGVKAAAYLVTIGEEPGGLACGSWRVYMALEFESSDLTKDGHAALDPSDKLDDIHIKKLGRCL